MHLVTHLLRKSRIFHSFVVICVQHYRLQRATEVVFVECLRVQRGQRSKVKEHRCVRVTYRTASHNGREGNSGLNFDPSKRLRGDNYIVNSKQTQQQVLTHKKRVKNKQASVCTNKQRGVAYVQQTNKKQTRGGKQTNKRTNKLMLTFSCSKSCLMRR